MVSQVQSRTFELAETGVLMAGAERGDGSVKPPHSPWVQLTTGPEEGGYLSFYYSEDLSRLPIRGVSRPSDSKSDPNLETQTYGLFSTCAPKMRACIVRRGLPYLFFQTRRDEERVLTGYYHVKWYFVQDSGRAFDFGLAADLSHFVEHPITIRAVGRLLRRRISQVARAPLLLSAEEARILKQALDEQPDAASQYIAEIDRLERFNLRYGGTRHVGWHSLGADEKYGWEAARRYLQGGHPTPHSPGRIRNTSDTGWWKCSACEGVFKHPVLLRLCRACGARGTLRPAKRSEIAVTTKQGETH